MGGTRGEPHAGAGSIACTVTHSLPRLAYSVYSMYSIYEDRICRYIEIIRRYITYIQRHIGANSHLWRYYPVSNVQQYTQAPLSRAQVNRTNSIQQWHGANILISVIYLVLHEMRRRGHEGTGTGTFFPREHQHQPSHHPSPITHYPSPPTRSLIYYIRTILPLTCLE